ncbi:glycerophosphodiester phosphodiesterase [Paenibacillus sp. HJGM_3]|uniref:glycerophosphodiester phosphodiesterase n=1 Tax=Paenibacillus sp. HJGM_3 TaxID=3379816 RepID=UPI0038597F80
MEGLLIIGHRGAAGMAPENTLGSFRLAVEQGSGAIELDVHFSADGRMIVCHDATIDRTTDRSGAIRELASDQLRAADAGSWYGTERAFAGERLPFLEEVFAAVPPEVAVNVEIKSSEPAHLRTFAAYLAAESLFDRVFVSSFHKEILVALKEVEPRVQIGYLYDQVDELPSVIAASFGAELYSLHPHHRFVNAAYMAQAKELGLQVYPWTVNGAERMQELIDVGVSGIITDFPGRLHELLGR